MSTGRDHCFVLWADRFDETAAVLFVAELRRVGLRVRLVGLPGPSFVGIHGLALTPDLTLDEALAQVDQLICLVAPCDEPALGRVANDPRLLELFDLAAAQEAAVVVGSEAGVALSGGRGVVYSQGQGIYRQVRRLARQLRPRRRSEPTASRQPGWQGMGSIA